LGPAISSRKFPDIIPSFMTAPLKRFPGEGLKGRMKNSKRMVVTGKYEDVCGK
jgi:hypothetical protein